MTALTPAQSRQLSATLRAALLSPGIRGTVDGIDFSLSVTILADLLGLPLLRTFEVLGEWVREGARCDLDVLRLLSPTPQRTPRMQRIMAPF